MKITIKFMNNCPEIVIIPLNPREESSTIIQTMTIEEILEVYGECAYESIQKYFRQQELDNPKNDLFMNMIEKRVEEDMIQYFEDNKIELAQSLAKLVPINKI